MYIFLYWNMELQICETIWKHWIYSLEVYFWRSPFSGTKTYSNPAYNELLKSIKHKIKEGKFFLKDSTDRRTILRIGIHSLGSPMWLPHRKSLHSIETTRDLDMFIFCLRALVRSAYAVAVVTIPTHLYHEVSSIYRFRASLVVRVTFFALITQVPSRDLHQCGGLMLV